MTGDCGRHRAPAVVAQPLRIAPLVMVDPVLPSHAPLGQAEREARANDALPEVLERLSATSIAAVPATNRVVTARSPYGTLLVKTMVHTNGAEPAALSAWSAAGIPVADVVASGRASNTAPFIATRLIEGTTPDVTDRFEDIAGLLRRMHDTPVPVGVARPPADGSDVISGWAIDTLTEAGVGTGRLKVGIDRLLAEPGGALVHGDVKASNLIETADGGIVVIDPHGIVDHLERDLARLVLAADPDADVNLRLWHARLRAAYGRHDADRLARWVGGYLVVRAALATWQDREPVGPLVTRAELLLAAGSDRLAA